MRREGKADDKQQRFLAGLKLGMGITWLHVRSMFTEHLVVVVSCVIPVFCVILCTLYVVWRFASLHWILHHSLFCCFAPGSRKNTISMLYALYCIQMDDNEVSLILRVESMWLYHRNDSSLCSLCVAFNPFRSVWEVVGWGRATQHWASVFLNTPTTLTRVRSHVQNLTHISFNM